MLRPLSYCLENAHNLGSVTRSMGRSEGDVRTKIHWWAKCDVYTIIGVLYSRVKNLADNERCLDKWC